MFAIMFVKVGLGFKVDAESDVKKEKMKFSKICIILSSSRDLREFHVFFLKRKKYYLSNLLLVVLTHIN